MEVKMKVLLVVLGAVLVVLGILSLLSGFGVLALVSSAHHLRYELGGAVAAIAGIVLFVLAGRRKQA
jgi:hypothetical protein